MAAKTKSSAELQAQPDARELTITRVFDAPRALVFKMWTNPEYMKCWSSPKGFTVVSNDGELRRGGPWRAHMRSPEGDDYRLRGHYREIVENERLVFTHAWVDEAGKAGHETVVTVTFADEGKMTRMTFHQAMFATIPSRDGHAEGWGECFDKLAIYLGQVEAGRPRDHARLGDIA